MLKDEQRLSDEVMIGDEHDDCDERDDFDDRDQELNEENNTSHNSLQDELGELRNELEDFEEDQSFILKPSFEQDDYMDQDGQDANEAQISTESD